MSEKSYDDTSKDKSAKKVQKKDDWNIGKENNRDENEMKIETPSFIRLFVIRRVIENYLKNCNKKEKNAKIEKLANIFSKTPETKSIVFDTITRLINDGIKKYMNKWYNDKTQPTIIEMIFNEIILKEFEKEYHKLVTCVGNEFERNMIVVFNSRDLMSERFKYSNYGDIVSCSLVNSHWLYYALNINVYSVDDELDTIVAFSFDVFCLHYFLFLIIVKWN